MKTLILNGSPRRNGDTAALIDCLTQTLQGEVRQLSISDQISPCLDCRRCWTKPGCAIQDKMQEIYPYLESCENFVLASPIWFSSLSGPLLNLASRFQTYFAGRFFRNEAFPFPAKNGVILLTGGEPGTEEAPLANALTIFKMIHVRRPPVAVIRSMDTNHLPAQKDTRALEAARNAAQLLNRLQDAPFSPPASLI